MALLLQPPGRGDPGLQRYVAIGSVRQVFYRFAANGACGAGRSRAAAGGRVRAGAAKPPQGQELQERGRQIANRALKAQQLIPDIR